MINLKNFRDFSGYRRNTGTMLGKNRFARSNNPAFLSDVEIAELRQRDLTCIIDLRRDCECEVCPDYLSSVSGFMYHHIVMNDEPYARFNEVVNPEDIAAAFFSKLTVSADRIGKIFKIFAQTETGVLFHCESGKDRTGTIAALLLLLNDIVDEDIVEDYRLSYDIMYNGSDEILLADPTLIPKKETMEHFLMLFRRKYNVCDDYFLNIGLTADDLLCIRKKYSR